MSTLNDTTPKRLSLDLKGWFCLVFGTVILFGAGIGFIGKIMEFYRTWVEHPEAKFAIIPVVTYLITAMGFACIFVWATLHGMLTDIEGPKYRMLENEKELENMEARANAARKES